MTLAQYVQIVRAQWLLIVAVTALGALAASVYSLLATPVYSATAQMFVTTRGAESDISQLTQGSTFSQQRVKSYAAIITSPAVLAPVIEQLGLDETPKDLGEHVQASTPLDTVLLELSVQDTSPGRAKDIANAIASQFATYVTRLELPTGSATSPVKITVTGPAVIPEAPDSPRKTLNLALGLLLGIGLGFGAAILRDTLDRTIGARHDAGAIAGAPVLSAIVDDADVKQSPLIVHNAFSPRAEAFRQLRTNIRFLSVDHEVRSLVVTSSVSGEGKSTTAANLAISMAQGSDKVVLIDADLRRPTIGDIFGLPAGIGLTSVLLGDVALSDAVQVWRDDLELRVLTSGPIPPNPSELIGSSRMVQIVEQLVAEGYVVVVDSPPLLPVTDGAILARITNGAVVVARARSTRVEQLAAAAEALRTAGATILGVLVNCVPKSGSGYYYNADGYHSGPGAGAPPLPPASTRTPAPISPVTGVGVRSAAPPEPTAPPGRSTRRRAAGGRAHALQADKTATVARSKWPF
jgi:capsular exopolysaccharide synthesis family protein